MLPATIGEWRYEEDYSEDLRTGAGIHALIYPKINYTAGRRAYTLITTGRSSHPWQPSLFAGIAVLYHIN